MTRLIVTDNDYLAFLIRRLEAAGWLVLLAQNDYDAPRRMRRRLARARMRYVVVI